MLDEFLSRAESGLVHYQPDYGLVTLDFALRAKTGLCMFRLNWWKTEWGLSNEILTLDCTWTESNGVYRITTSSGRTSMLESIDSADDDVLSNFRNARLYQDLDRDAYLAQLTAVRDRFIAPEYAADIESWIEHWSDERPRVTIGELKATALARKRRVGIVILRDARGAVSDALALDENGFAATVTASTQFSGVANFWRSLGADDRPDVDQYVNGFSERTPFGPWSYEPAGTSERGGDIKGIASAAYKRARKSV